MTVAELIEELRDMPEDLEVQFSYNYGDHWNTDVAASVKEVDIDEVGYSSYHRMDKVLDGADPEDYERVREVVLLR